MTVDRARNRWGGVRVRSGRSGDVRHPRLSGPGNRTATPAAEGFDTTLRSWPLLAGVDVLAGRPDAGLQVIGDSVVDGVGSTPDGDDRFPDQLAARLDTAGGARVTTVLSAGLSCNQLLQDDPPAGGDSPLSRFDADVARVAGVRDVLLLIGTNDIGCRCRWRRARSGPAGVRGPCARRRAAGAAGHRSALDQRRRDAPVAVEARDRATDRIRTEGPHYADGVIDAAAVPADPADRSRLRPDYDSGDGLHPSPAGYRAPADAVPLEALSGSPCRDHG